MAAAALLPVLCAAAFYALEKKPEFARMTFYKKQTVIGAAFGILAILSTEFGIPVEGAMLNARNAAPLTAGMVFGWPAGIVAGFIGGSERWLASLWGVAEKTRLAGTLATIFAGFFGAAVKEFMMDDKKTSWLYGIAVGVTTEVMHMLILFVTNFSDLHAALNIIQKCALPMISACGLSVMCSSLLVSHMSGEKMRQKKDVRKIAHTFQRWLLVCVVLAFFATGMFTYRIQSRLSNSSAEDLLMRNLEDVQRSIEHTSDEELLAITRSVASVLRKGIDSDSLRALAKSFGVSEINVVDSNGVIALSNDDAHIGFNMDSGEQSREFLALLNGTKELVQLYQPMAINPQISRKYAGVALADGGFVQVGYDAGRFQSKIALAVAGAAKYRRIGQTGCIIICDEQGMIVSDRDGHEGQNIELLGYDSTRFYEPLVCHRAEIYGEESLFMYAQTEGYFLVAVLPEHEAMFQRNASVYMLAFMEIIVFAALFIQVFFLIKRLVVRNIQKINASLAQITGGNLNVTVDVRSNEEFASLSDDINQTVDTLRHYIDEAAARIDKELEFARQIQHAALPSVFPPYPGRKDFSIFASMDAAKEVGGDFYDFYLIGEHRLAFLVADVSGKGIPAAMFMMNAKTLIKGLVESGHDLDEAFTIANDRLCQNNDAGMFVTAWMGILDLQTGNLRYVNAGHNPPAIRRAGGQFELLKSRANLVLAIMDGIRYRSAELTIEPGDEIYLYTDGVTEAKNNLNKLFGDERLLLSLNKTQEQTVEERCMTVKKDVESFVGDAPQFDDMTMLCVKRSLIKNGETLELQPDMQSIPRVKEFLRQQAQTLMISDKQKKSLMVVVDEIYSNIIHYSGAKTASIFVGKENDKLTVVFSDDGMPYNPLMNNAPDIDAPLQDRMVGGLGIFMVRKITESADYEYKDHMNRLTLVMKPEA